MIPNELKAIPQWVCAKNGSKAPFDPLTGRMASVAKPDTWRAFPDALKGIEKGLGEYPGFVFNGNGIVGIDIDDGWTEDGFVSPLAAEIIRECESYTEISRSGRGFHILVRGTLPFDGRNNRTGVEVYQKGRYFIMTGKTLIYTKIQENQKALDWLVDKHFPEMRESSGNLYTRKKVYEPEWPLPDGTKIPLRPNYPQITPGTRNISLTSLGGAMWNLGYNQRQIRKELEHVNAVACSPKLPKSEIFQITNSVTRYKR